MTKTTRLLRPAIALAALLSVAACSFTPQYQRPALAVPDQLPLAPANAAATPAPAVAELPWTTYFPDTRLQGLIRQALDQNRDLRVAMLTIEQWRATYQIQNADRFPTLSGAVSGSRGPSRSRVSPRRGSRSRRDRTT